MLKIATAMLDLKPGDKFEIKLIPLGSPEEE